MNNDKSQIYKAPKAAAIIHITVFIGACCIMGLDGPSEANAPCMVLVCVMKRKIPDMM
jgi:hypothetical protein|tara:strand:- start:210 stop:383 length:174 start_codon:yes stop_codon:yes gene_type:complete